MSRTREATRRALDGVRDASARAAAALRGHPVAHRALRGLALLVVALLGLLAATRLVGGVSHAVGPLDTSISFSLSPKGGTHVEIPPLGSLRMRDHVGPVQLHVHVDQLREGEARRLLRDPAGLAGLPKAATDDVRSALLRLALRSGTAAVAGALVLALLVYRRWRPVAAAGAVAAVAVAASYAIAAATFNPRALAEPRFYGLLSDAPSLVGDAREIVANFDRYSSQLAKLTENVARLYDTTSTLPTYEPSPETLRILHVSDIHDNPEAFDVIRSVIKQFQINAIIDSGDLTDHGTPVENRLAVDAGQLGVPYVWVRGNHDSTGTERAMSKQRSVVVLDGTPREVLGLRLFGIGDPRFTPDKRRDDDSMSKEALQQFGQLTAYKVSLEAPIDIAVVHDPIAGAEVIGQAPIVLSGHIHKRDVQETKKGVMLVEGSTGGAGLRGLEGDEPTPLECTVLYLDRLSHKLQAYDEITVGGLGTSSVRIARHVVAKPS